MVVMFNQVNARIDRLQAETSVRFDAVNKRFDFPCVNLESPPLLVNTAIVIDSTGSISLKHFGQNGGVPNYQIEPKGSRSGALGIMPHPSHHRVRLPLQADRHTQLNTPAPL